MRTTQSEAGAGREANGGGPRAAAAWGLLDTSPPVAALAGVVWGWGLALGEIGRVHVRWGNPFAGLDQLLLFGLATVALLTCAGALVGGALGALWAAASRGTGRPRAAAALVAALACAPLWWLNAALASSAPAVFWGLLPAGTLAVSALAWGWAAVERARSSTQRVAPARARWALWVGLPGVAVGAQVANALVLPGLYPLQHASLAYLSLAAGGLWIWSLLDRGGHARAERRAAPHAGAGRTVGLLVVAATAVVWLQSFVVLAEDLTPGTRMVLGQGTLTARHVLAGLETLVDRDGDGYSPFLGGPDCDDGDPATSPIAADLPDDGHDQDCLGGDLQAADVQGLLDRMDARLPAQLRTGVPPHSLVLVTVDALRYDAAGGMRSLARLGDRGATFERAYAAIPSTVPSMHSLSTGRVPSALRLVALDAARKWEVPRGDTSRTLAEQAAAQGYDTAGFFYFHLFRRGLGLVRGFQTVWAAPANAAQDDERSAERLVDMAIEQLRASRARSRPVLLWVHIYDPHAPYLPDPAAPPAPDASARQRYLSEVAYVDRHLGRLLDTLEGQGAFEDTVVAVTADHGEAFGEHGRLFHNSDLHEEQVRVPLVIAAPQLRAPRRVQAPVSLVGLGPTLAELAGLPPLPDAQIPSFAGRVLGLALDAQQPPPVFLELSGPHAGRLEAVIIWPWKLVHDVERHALSLTHLGLDPGELRNVADQLPERSLELQRLLGAYRGVARRSPVE